LSRRLQILEIAAVDFSFDPAPWAFAEEEAPRIAVHWADLRRRKPALYNGRVLMLGRRKLEASPGVGARTLKGSFFETDYASFVAWQAFGYPGTPVENCFSMAALRAGDGGFLLGEMAPHTFNAGQTYFPSGTPDPSDVIGDKVDLDSSARRELFEETGISASEARVDPGWTFVLAGRKIAAMKLMTLPMSASEAKARIEAFLTRDPKAEFSRIHIVRRLADIDDTRTPDFVLAYLRAALEETD